MQADKQQQIIGYFIEEAKEHLDTLESGLLNLQTTVEDDPESINEMFRAAHSVKGGAAMLGFTSIQKTAHHLEDCLKVLKEQPLQVDEKLVTLFLQGFDTLRVLTDELQSPFGLRPEVADEIVRSSEPAFNELQGYLNELVGGGAEPSSTKLAPDFANRFMNSLKQMLVLFKQADSVGSRQQLQSFCSQLSQLCPNEPNWQAILKVSQSAIANSQNSYQVLAPAVIKELKQAGELLQARRIGEIVPSSALQKLAGSIVVQTSLAPAQPASAPAQSAPPTPTTTTSPAANKLEIPLDPKAAAQVLIKGFNRQQLTELTKLLITAVKQQT